MASYVDTEGKHQLHEYCVFNLKTKERKYFVTPYIREAEKLSGWDVKDTMTAMSRLSVPAAETKTSDGKPINQYGEQPMRGEQKTGEEINCEHRKVTIQETGRGREREYKPREFIPAVKERQSGKDLGAGVVRQGRKQHIRLQDNS